MSDWNNCVKFAADNAGKHFNEVRDSLFKLDWSGLYPVVDDDGDLTGETIDATQTPDEYVICDIRADGTVVMHEGCSDAMIVGSWGD